MYIFLRNVPTATKSSTNLRKSILKFKGIENIRRNPQSGKLAAGKTRKRTSTD